MNLLIIYFVIITIPLIFAAVQPWVWSSYTAAFFIVFLMAFWKNGFAAAHASDKYFNIPIVCFFLITLLQILPLPLRILYYISPYRYDALVQAHALIGRSLSWQAVSYSSKTSFAWWIFLLSVVLFVSVLKKHCISHRNLSFVIRLLVIIATAEALYGLIQSLVPGTGVLWVDSAYPGCATGTYVNRNHFAGFIEMIWPLALGYALSMGIWRKGHTKSLFSSEMLNFQLLFVLAIIIMLLALLLSRSRGGIIGGTIGLLTFLGLVQTTNKGFPPLLRVMLGVIAFFLLIYGFTIGFTPIIERFLKIGVSDGRLDLWQYGFAIFKGHPLGIGLGNTPDVLAVYRVADVSPLRQVYLHNDYLQLLVETGILGFIMIVSGGLIFLWKSILRIRRLTPQQDAFRFFIAIGALSGVISVMVHSFFDFNLQIPANCFYFVLLIGVVYACVQPRSSDENLRVDHQNSMHTT